MEHMAFPKPAIVAMFPTRGGWRASCSCGWMEGKTHRSEHQSDRAARGHMAEAHRQARSNVR